MRAGARAAPRVQRPVPTLPMQDQPTAAELPDDWRVLAAQLRSLGGDAQARTLEWCADQLTPAVRQKADELLSLHRASEESGYSMDHLGRLLREGKIPNSGRRAKPLIRRRDLPVKASRHKAQACASPPLAMFGQALPGHHPLQVRRR